MASMLAYWSRRPRLAGCQVCHANPGAHALNSRAPHNSAVDPDIPDMNLIKTLLACLILIGLQMPATAAADPSQFRLTEELLRKLKATDAEAKKLAAAERKA